MARAGATVINKADGLIGEYKDYSGLTLPSGWLWCDGKTIGNAASGATGRANADTRSLFIHLWNNFANTELAVSGGRGASALADFNANKTIVLPDLRGRAVVGKDDMGGTAANRITSGGAGINGIVNGAAGGAQTHTITTAQLPSHTHPLQGWNQNNNIFGGNGSVNTTVIGTQSNTGLGSLSQTFPTGAGNQNISTIAQGSGNSHQNTQPSYIASKMIKYL